MWFFRWKQGPGALQDLDFAQSADCSAPAGGRDKYFFIRQCGKQAPAGLNLKFDFVINRYFCHNLTVPII